MNGTTANNDDRSQAMGSNATLGIPKCVCGWKNCRVYQKTFRELHHDYWDGVIKLKFAKGEPESMALKDSIDRILKVDPNKRNDWKKVKNAADGQEVMRYTIARHHFTERHIAKYLQDPRNYSFLKPFTEHGAKKYLASVDPTFTLKGEDGEVLFLQVPNNTKEIVKAHYMRLKGQPAPAAAGGGGSIADFPAPAAAMSNNNTGQANNLLQQKEQENLKLKEQLESMQSQLTFLHDMVRKLQEEHFDHQSVKSGGGYGGSGPGSGGGGGGGGAGPGFRPRAAQGGPPPGQGAGAGYRGSMRSRHTISSRSGRSGVPHEIELGDDVVSTRDIGDGDSQFYPENEFDWSEHLEYEGECDETTVGTFQGPQSMRRRNSVGSVTSKASRATSIVSASKSIKSLPREIELDEDDDDSESHESLEEEAFDNRSMVSSVHHNQYGGPSGHSRSIDSDGGDNFGGPAAMGSSGDGRRGDQYAKQGPNSRKPARRNSNSNSMSGSSHGLNPGVGGAGGSASVGTAGRSKRRSSLASHLNKDKTGGTGGAPGASFGGGGNPADLASTDQSTSVAGTYQVQALVVTDPYGEQGTYTGSISNSTNMPHGYGRLEYDRAGRWYEGDWKHGRWTGQGRLSNGDGDYYEGGLKNDHKHGRGIMKFADGRIFEGEYINGQMIEGKMTYQDGSTYTGTWVDGMRHGKGRCVFTDNSVYEGEFREGEFFGFGKMTWSDGGWYEGNWVYGEMDGFGKEVRPDGSLRHEGQWRKGQPIRK